MKLSDLQQSQIITHPTKGKGLIEKITARTIKIKYDKMTSRRTFRKNNQEFDLSDL